MARKFLYIVAGAIVLVLIAALALSLFATQITRFVFVPSGEFVEQEPLAANAYEDPALWYSRPGIGTSDPARWQPAYAPAAGNGEDETEGLVGQGTIDEDVKARVISTDQPDFAVFFVHPTSYTSTDNWNAPLEIAEDADAAEADRIVRIYLRGMASPFNAASEIWAPRYRQATMGAFLTDGPEGQQAMDAAYADVREAWRYFLDSIGEDTPIVIAGHSQGALHLIRLLKDEVKETGTAERLVAAYAVGWPISVEHDLPAIGFPACEADDQTGCVLSWSSFAVPADPEALIDAYSASAGFDGNPRGASEILCTNPITGTYRGVADARRNAGTLRPDDSMADGELVPGAVPATCDTRGLLLIGSPPEMGSFVLPGNNYHVYDIPLFWANTKLDVARRVQAFTGAAAEGGETGS